MVEKRDYYEVLGIAKNAALSDIKKAYRKLAKEYHPDHNKSEDAESRFKEVREAYEVLSNDEKRRAYDQYGHAATQGFNGFGTEGVSGFNGGSPFDMGDLGDILNSFFGGGMGGFGGVDFGFGGGQRRGTRTRVVRGEDIKKAIELAFEDAIWGKDIELEVERYVSCEECSGTGALGGELKKCDQCDGIGRVRRVQSTILGSFSVVTECPKCGGGGQIAKDKCKKCGGTGILAEKKKINVSIPQGSYDGMILRFRHGGHAGKSGGEPGDLYVELRVEPHSIFERQGDDIYVDIDLPVAMAVLGGKIAVQTIHGEIEMKIPAGTQPNTVFKLNKKGAPKFQGKGFGDEYVRVKIEVPRKLNREERKLWEQLNQRV